MGYARLIGRVGALAVALGVGTAVGFPVIGNAAPDSGAEASDSPAPDQSAPAPAADEPTGGPEKVDADLTDGPSDDDAVDPADDDADLDADADLGDLKRDKDAPPPDDSTPEVKELPDDPALSDQSDEQAVDLDEDLADDGEADKASTNEGDVILYTMAGDSAEVVTTTSVDETEFDTPAPESATTGVVSHASDVLANALAPLLSLGDNAPATPNPGLLALLGFTRREAEQNLAQAPLASVQQLSAPQLFAAADIGSKIEDFLIDALAWLKTKVIWPYISNRTPVTAPQQVVLAAGNPATTVKFDAHDPDGNTMVFTVNGAGLPGAPQHGTVVVNPDNTFTYTPGASFAAAGQDTFSYAVNDDTNLHFHFLGFFNESFAGHQNTATVTVFANGSDTSEITSEFTVLTYNVAGLPFPLSSATFPRYSNTQEIGNRINEYADVVNVQEDFAYHWWLIRDALFPAQTVAKPPTRVWPLSVPFGDGLNTLSSFGMRYVDREAWEQCHADNCLTPKGLSVSELQLPGGQTVDVYNVHMNTGGGEDTNANIQQLYDYIQKNSAGKAVIITGDFNERYSDSGETLSTVLLANGFDDAWVEQEYGGIAPVPPLPTAPVCDDDVACEQLDKIYYRSSTPSGGVTQVKIEQVPNSYENLGTSFLNSKGEPLSDHRPQSVRFKYTVQNLYTP